jgi:nucleotide-binding universal stress UspA family protein
MAAPLILITTDFSAEAERAYAPALELAQKLDARVTILHVVQDLVTIPRGAALAPPQHEPDLSLRVDEAEKRLEEVVKQFKTGVQVEAIVRTAEHPAKEVAHFAESQKAAFIAMASHGRSGIRRVLMGSFAETVLRHVITPVIIYPRPT